MASGNLLLFAQLAKGAWILEQGHYLQFTTYFLLIWQEEF